MTNLMLRIILGLVYCMVYFFKVQEDKISFISYKANKVEGNFRLISEELDKKKKYKLVYVLINYENNIKGKFKYLLNCIVQVYHINTSKVVILDYNNYVVSNFKKKKVTVFQIWHGSGAIKKFGNDIKRRYRIKNYDYVLSTSDEWKEPYSSAFGIDENKIIPLGIPKTDSLFSKDTVKKYKSYILEKYPQASGKKIVLYAPTFRGDHLENTKYLKVDLKKISDELGDEYIVIYKLHPLLKDVVLCNNSKAINANNESIIKLLASADYLITDYSSILFDYTILKRPIILFSPDLNEYQKDVGMYIDYSNIIPSPICNTESEVIDVIKDDRFRLDDIEVFSKKFFKYRDGKSKKRIADFIEQIMEQ